jgi:hypothetical protein
MASFSLDLINSICTDNPTGSDVYPFTPGKTHIVQNTGIERNGGISAQFEQETTFTISTDTVIAKDGTVIQVDSSNNVLLNNRVIGNVGTLAVYARGVLPGYYTDAVWTKDSTILGLRRNGYVLTIDEYDPFNATVTHTRSITWASFPTGVSGIATAIGDAYFVRYVDMSYSDNQEFVFARGRGSNASAFLMESGTSAATITSTGFRVDFAFRFQAGTVSYLWGAIGYQSNTASAPIGIRELFPAEGPAFPISPMVSPQPLGIFLNMSSWTDFQGLLIQGL